MKTKQFRTMLHEKCMMVRIFFQLKMDALRLSLAIFMANALQRAKNKRFYVIPNAQNKLIWVCNDDIDQMKRPRRVRKIIDGKLRTFTVRMMPKHLTHLDVMRECLYYTPIDRNNSNGITVEERNKKQAKWLSYMEKVRMDRMFGKLKAK